MTRNEARELRGLHEKAIKCIAAIDTYTNQGINPDPKWNRYQAAKYQAEYNWLMEKIRSYDARQVHSDN